jgi:alpha-L-rhamnosidase
LALLVGMATLTAGASAAGSFTVTDLRCEDLVDPLGVEAATPRLSWRMEADSNGAAQKAYRVLCATSPERLREGAADLWDSGQVQSDQSQYVSYGGKMPGRGIPCHWTVRIWNEKGEASPWSNPGVWTTFDMTSNADWKAKWITRNYKGSAAPWMRRSFELDAPPQRAYIYVNALGYFQLFINGQRIGSDEFAPHVGQYDKRTLCLTYDVSKHLKKGKNTIGIWMGSAWNRNGAGVRMAPTVRAQLEIVDDQGKATTIITDENWRAKPSSMSYTGEWKWGNFGGEVYDARLDEPGWANPDYDDSTWTPVALGKVSTPVVSAEMLQRNRVIETLIPISIKNEQQTATSAGDPVATASWLIDMGKAMTGTFEITLPGGPAGHEVKLEFGDAIGKDGRLNSFSQKSTYIYRGSGVERFTNRFNYASFQYVRVTNVPKGEITPANIKGFLITTDLPKASTFRCSDETLNKIYGMMEHTLHCLMLGGYQVDCHSRERQGYGGDGHSSLDTTLCLLRSEAFYRKWTQDWIDQQAGNGGLTYTSPASGHGGGPFWSGFLTAATLKHYHHYGDLSLVERNYPAIKKWFELAQSKMKDGLQEKFTTPKWYLGDWASPKGDDRSAKNDGDVFIQAYMCYALEQAALLAEALTKTEDARMFREWAEARRAAAHRKQFIAEAGKYGSGRQMTYILPLAGGVVPDKLRDQVFAGYERTLKDTDMGHLETGLSGTYMAVQYLQQIGRDDLIYLFASKKTQPSWGYMIEQGATATWEHWNGRASRIHNCFNNIGSWFIQGLAGIRPDTSRPGFKNAVIKPAVLKELSHVEGSHDTAYGTIHSSWKREGDNVTMNIQIPANSTATIHVPAADVKKMTVNGKAAGAAPHVKFLKQQNGRVLLQVESGKYQIVTTIDNNPSDR